MGPASSLQLVIVPLRGAHPVRVPITRRITSLGSDPTADLRLPTAPAHWAVVHRSVVVGDEQAVEVLVASTGQRHRLVPGQSLEADGITLGLESSASALERERAIEQLVSALAAVESPDRAIELLLTGLIGAASADLGALILVDGESYTVGAARDRDGAVLDAAGELLSDTIVRDVLGTGERVQLDDVAAHSRYAAIPSVTALRLGSALCLPMRLDGKTLGAVFLARHDRAVVDDRTLAELRILAAVAVPFLAQLRRTRVPLAGRDELLGESPAVQTLRGLVRRVGPSDLSALLHGPSGSGKELVARALHAASPRTGRPMIAINCASVAPTLLDAELFGYRKGAFTGAVTDRVGLVEAAHESTLFLDEIGDMPLAMQAALLRVLEQREVKRLGDNLPRPVDFRLICATHRDLDAEVTAGRFRADLLFRLREVTIPVPSLAERGGVDIVLLAHAFLRQVEAQLGLTMHTLTDDAQAALSVHLWPGNVRELKATMRRVAILADSKLVRAADLGFAPRPSSSSAPQLPAGTSAGSAAASVRALIEAALAPDAPIQPLAALRDELVRRYIQLALERTGDDREAAAKALEIGVRTLYRAISS
ncbi:MAG: two component, sigma54 specific, transcriptional regulator, Fis family [Deltaproteobacteria bacterium]|nr:two component, sigma54 specific, transcriptional regulator, Fis family [Deltaproteobacteria bacterium]